MIAFDFGITLLGQPSSYWHDSHTANEGNPVFAWFMMRGIVSYIAFIAVYMISVAVLVRMLPRQIGITAGLVFLLSHYFAASTWLDFHFKFNMIGPIIYATVLSMALLTILQSGPSPACSTAGEGHARVH